MDPCSQPRRQPDPVDSKPPKIRRLMPEPPRPEPVAMTKREETSASRLWSPDQDGGRTIQRASQTTDEEPADRSDAERHHQRQSTFVSDEIKRTEISTDAVTAAKKTDLVVEAIVENLDTKRKFFTGLGGAAPEHTINVFASNTSSLTIKEIASVTKRLDHFGRLHFELQMDSCSQPCRQPAPVDSTPPKIRRLMPEPPHPEPVAMTMSPAEEISASRLWSPDQVCSPVSATQVGSPKSILASRSTTSDEPPLMSILVSTSRSSTSDEPPLKSILSSRSTNSEERPLKSILKSRSSDSKERPLKSILKSRSSTSDQPPRKSILASRSSDSEDRPLKSILKSRSSTSDQPPRKSILKSRSSTSDQPPLKSILVSRSSDSEERPLKSILKSRSSTSNEP